MARFGIGIIGAGGIAQAHAAAYRRSAAAALVAFADVNAAAARSAAERHECTALSVDELLARQDIDVISICTPPDSHADLACRALEAGKHVLVEKPLTATLSEADRLCELSKRPGAPMVMVAHSHRFWPANQKAKALLDEGAIGTVLSVTDDILAESRYDPANPPWRMRRAMAGGGVVMDNGVHAFDRLRYWLDRPVTAVSGYMWTVTPESEVEDNASIQAVFAAAGDRPPIVAHVRLSRTTPAAAGRCTAEFIGTEGVLRVSTWGEVELCRRGEAWQTVPYDRSRDAFDLEIEAFLRAIERGDPSPVSAAEGRRSLACVLAFYEAAARGGIVDVDAFLARPH